MVMAVKGSIDSTSSTTSPVPGGAKDCRQYYTLGADFEDYEEDFECDEAVDVPIEKLKLAFDDVEEDRVRGSVEGQTVVKGAADMEDDSQKAVSLAEELFEAATRETFRTKNTSREEKRPGLKEIFVNRLDSESGSVPAIPGIDVVIRSEPLPYGGADGYAASPTGTGRGAPAAPNPKRILIKRVGLVNEMGFPSTCGPCGVGCCIS